MRLLAIDPGPVRSALVVLRVARELPLPEIEAAHLEPNAEILRRVHAERPLASTLVVEQIRSYGMSVGAEVFDTCVWSGRFAQTWCGLDPAERGLVWMPRPDVKLALCGTARAKDGNIAQALRDLYGPRGTKRQPGPTYGIAGDLWAALAVGTAHVLRERERPLGETHVFRATPGQRPVLVPREVQP